MKVAIVGAGITGLYLAWKLTEKGETVTVFEKRDIIGKEACSGLISERILGFFPESKKLIQNEINECLIHFPKRTFKIKFRKKFFVMNHFDLDNLAADLARKAGAKIVLNNPVNSLPSELDYVIGCDGAMSKMRKNLGLSDPNFKLGIQGFSSENSSANFVETWPTKNGFLWKIPRGDKTEYGIMEEPRRAREIFNEFTKKNNLRLEAVKSAVIAQGFVSCSNTKATLCGEAAGLTKPWSGGGVIWGLTAANLLLKNFPNFIKYQKELKRKFLLEIYLSKIAKKIVYFLGFNSPWLLPGEFKIDGDFFI